MEEMTMVKCVNGRLKAFGEAGGIYLVIWG